MWSFHLVSHSEGPVLDLFCGTKPYLELIPWRPLWGVDLDDHFGRADVQGTLPLPFRDGAFGIVFCSQALYLVDDPVGTVQEIARVLRSDGHVIVTIPHLFLAEGDFERHWSREDLRALFAGWDEVRIIGIDGPGAALALVLGRLARLAARRWRPVEMAFTPGILILNAVCRVLDIVSHPLHRRWPHSLVLVARRPSIPGTAASGGERPVPTEKIAEPESGPQPGKQSPSAAIRFARQAAVAYRAGRYR